MKLLFIVNILFILASCSSITSGEPDKKNEKFHLHPTEKWIAIDSDKADYAFIKNDTNSIIFANSICRKYENSSIKNLMYSMLGNTDYKILNEKKLTLFNRASSTYEISTKVDGIATFLNIILLKKDRCIYDFVMINTNQAKLTKGVTDFHNIVKASDL